MALHGENNMRKKHVLFIVENNPVPYDARVWAEARAVKELGHDVSVICPRSPKSPKALEELEGISIHRHYAPLEAGRKSGFIFEYLNALFWEFVLSIRIFKRDRFHVIHSANPPDHVFIIAAFFKLLGVKFIFDHHDICPENYLAKFGRRDLFYRSLLIAERLTFETADIVISTNESYKSIAIDRGRKCADEVFVVRNGPDLSRVTFPEPNKKLREGFEYLVAYLGEIGNQEGIDILLRSIRHIVTNLGIANIKFILIGTGPHWKQMVALSKQMGLERFVEFTGFIPFKDLYEILSTADLCVNPEFKNDFTDRSTMLKIMDYMTFGKPILQFHTREGEVTAGMAAIYITENDEVKFAEALLYLLHDPDKRKKMGEAGSRRIREELCWDKQKINLKNAYLHLLNGKGIQSVPEETCN